MWQFIKKEYWYLYGTFHNSETILWARLNIMIGAAWWAGQQADLSPFFHNPKYLLAWQIFSNFVNEVARRNRAEYDENGNIR